MAWNEEAYLAANLDVAASVNKTGGFSSGWQHYQAFGQAEGRALAPTSFGTVTYANFDNDAYLAANPDVAKAIHSGTSGFLNGWQHFVQNGFAEGRALAPATYGTFNEDAYLAANADVAKAVTAKTFASGWQHYQSFGKAEGRATAPANYGSFNEYNYLCSNPDVAAAVKAGTLTSGWQHYSLLGAKEGRPMALDAIAHFGDVTPAQTFTLTTGTDTAANFTGGAGNDIFNANDVFVGLNAGESVYANTLSALDHIDGGAGVNTLNVVSAAAIVAVPNATVTNIQTANLTSGDTVVDNVSLWTGLTQLNATSYNGTTVTAAATTNVTATATAGGTTVNGGLNVNASATAGDVAVNQAAGAVTATATAGAVTIGAGVDAAGVSNAVKGAVTAVATGAISVVGGTSLDLTTKGGVSTAQENLNSTAATVTTVATAATATALVATDAGLKAGADAVVTALTTLTTALAASTTTTQVIADGFVATALAAGAINDSQASMIRTAYAAGFVTSVAAAKAGAAAVAAPIVTAANTADATAITTLAADTVKATAAADAVTAAVKVVTDGIQANATAASTVLTSAVVHNSDSVTINDTSAALNHLTTVTLNATGVAALTGNALTSVSLANTLSSVTITNMLAHTEALTLNNVTGGTITDAHATTLAVTTTGAASKGLTLTDALATTLTVAGNQNFDATITAGLVKAATISTTGNFTADLTGLHAAAVIDATSSTGANHVTVGVGQAYAGGSGVDTVTITNLVPTAALSGGAGTADELVVNVGGAFNASSITKISGFETLGLGAAATGAHDATGFTSLHVGSVLAAAAGFDHVAAGVGLTIDGATVGAVTYTLKDATSTTSDAMALTIGNATTKGLTVGGAVDTTGVELMTVHSVGTGGTEVNTVSITNPGLLSLTVDGNEKTTFTALAGATIKNIDLSAATKMVDVSLVTVDATGVTAFAGAGGAKITGGAGIDHIIGAAGADTLVGGAGADVIVGGGGKDVITGGTGADAITISGGANKLVLAAGDSGANLTTNTQTSELVTGFDIVKGAVAGDKIDLHLLTHQYAFGDVIVGGANLAGSADHVVITFGTLDATAGTFTYAANGADSVVTYDAHTVTGGVPDPAAFESIILVGVHAGVNTSAALGVITLA